MSTTITDKIKFKKRVHGWAEKLGARVTSIAVRPMTTKWASYSTTGRLTFDAFLLELREGLQDYVIVHELLHSHAPNHGKFGLVQKGGTKGNRVVARTCLSVLS